MRSRRQIGVVLLCISIILTMGATIMAQTPATWSVSGSTLTVTGTGSTGTDAGIDPAGITTVVLSSGITDISAYAFAGYTDLVTVQVNGTVETIGASAFADCTSLREYGFAEGLEDIGNYAFCRCEDLFLFSKQLPSTVKHIGLAAFSNCQSLDLTELPEGLVCETASFAYTSLASLRTIPSLMSRSSVFTEDDRVATTVDREGVPARCFEGSGLTEVTILNETIEQQAFAFCKNLTTADLPNAKHLRLRAFSNDDKLVMDAMPEHLATLGGGVFFGCPLVNGSAIPNTIERDWMMDNFMGTSWNLTVEIYRQNQARTGYDLYLATETQAKALWLAQLDTTGESPVISISDTGAKYGLDGIPITTAANGPTQTIDVTELCTLPDPDKYFLRNDGVQETRIDTATEPVCISIYYDRITPTVSVTVPTSLGVAVDRNGNVSCPTEASIVNHSNIPVKITNLDIQPTGDWQVIAYETYDSFADAVDAKQFSMSVNGEQTQEPTESRPEHISFHDENWPSIDRERESGAVGLPISYSAKVAPQSTQISETMANVIFTVSADFEEDP